MGIFSGFSPEREGAGIKKYNNDKSRFKLFFELFFRHFWKIIELNILYVLFCIPIFTIGPATAGITKVLRNISLERPAYVWGDFWDSFKKNFKQSLPVGIADILMLAGIIIGCLMYPQIANETGNNNWYILFSLTLSAGIVFSVMNFYIYLMIVSTEIPLSAIIKNAFFLTCIALKDNIITFFIFAVISAVSIILAYYQIFLMLMIVEPATILGFIVCFRCYPIVQKYVINPYYEQKGELNPELEYNKPASLQESVFADASENAGNSSELKSDAPRVRIKKSRKNKTIS